GPPDRDDPAPPAPPGEELVDHHLADVAVGDVQLPDPAPPHVGTGQDLLHDVVGEVPVTGEHRGETQQRRQPPRDVLLEGHPRLPASSVCPLHAPAGGCAVREPGWAEADERARQDERAGVDMLANRCTRVTGSARWRVTGITTGRSSGDRVENRAGSGGRRDARRTARQLPASVSVAPPGAPLVMPGRAVSAVPTPARRSNRSSSASADLYSSSARRFSASSCLVLASMSSRSSRCISSW